MIGPELLYISREKVNGKKERLYLSYCTACGAERHVRKDFLFPLGRCWSCVGRRVKTEEEKKKISETLKKRIAQVAAENPTRKCTTCNRIKKRHLFGRQGKGGGIVAVCKACVKKASALRRANTKAEDYAGWKAQTLRGNWLARAKSTGADTSTVPTTKEIREWLLSQLPWECHYTGNALGNDIGVDHKIAIARGGSFDLDNLVLVSKKLNMAKGVMSDDEFMELLCLTAKWEDSGASLLRRLSVSGGIFSKNHK